MKLDELYWDLRARTEHLRGDFQAAQREARGFTRSIEGPGGPVEAVGKIGGAGKRVADELRSAGPDVARASATLADRILTTLDSEFRRKRIKLVSALGQGAISEAEFKRFGKDLAEEYNKGLKEGLKTLDQLGVGTDFGQRAKIVRAFKDLGEDAEEEFEEGFEKESLGFGDRLRGFFSKTRLIVAAIFTGIAAKAASELYKLGVSLDQTQRRFTAVFGEARESVDAFIKDFGRLTAVTQNEGRALTSSTGAIARGLGASEEQAAELAQQVFGLTAALRAGRETGEDFERTQDRIQKALLNQGEGVRDLGIAYDAASVRQLAFANRAKGTTGELTKLEIATAALQLIASQAGIDIQHLGENLDTPAARAERLGAAFRRMKEILAEALLPSFDAFAKKLDESDGKVLSLTRGLAEGFVGLARVVGNAFQIVGDLIAGALSNVQLLTLNVFHALGEQLNNLLEGIDRITPGRQTFRLDLSKIERDIASAEARATLAGDNVKKNWEELKEAGTQAFTAFSNADEPVVDALDNVDQKLGALAAQGGNLDTARTRMAALEEAIRRTKEELKELGKIEVRQPLAPGLGGGDFGLARSLQTGLNAVFPDLERRREQLIASGAQDEVRLRNAREELEKILLQLADGDVKGRKLRATMAALGVSLDDLKLPPALRELVQQLLDAADAADKADGHTDTLAKRLATFEGLARGVLSVADAMGALDDKSRRALQGVIDLASAAQRISKDPIGGGAQALGGLIAIGSALFGEDPETRRQRDELRRSVDHLTRSIDALAKGLLDVPGDIAKAIIDARDRAQQRAAEANVPDLLRGGFESVAFVQELRAAGVTGKDILELGDKLGLNLDDLAAAMDGASVDARRLGDEVSALGEALGGNARQAIEEFFGSFEGKLDLLQRSFDTFDIEDPIEQLKKWRELLLEFSDLPPDLLAKLKGADLDTPEGRAAFTKVIEETFARIAENPSLLFDLARGGITPTQLLDLLGQIESTLDSAKQDGTLGGGSTTPVEVRKAITELSANRLIATQDTAIIQRDKIIQILEAGLLGGPVPSYLLTPPVAPPAASAAGGVSVSLSLATGAVQVTIEDASGQPAASQAGAQRVADTVTDQLLDAIDARLGDRFRTYLDASGGSSP